MKNAFRIILIVLITVIGMIFVYEIMNKKEKEDIAYYNKKFKKEYENLNGKINEETSKEYPTVKIGQSINIVYANEKEIIDIIENKSGVIYFGYEECPWSRTALPVLLESAEETGIETIYYLNIDKIRDEKIIDENGNIFIEKRGTKGYEQLVKVLDDYLLPYKELNDTSIKRIYTPTVLFVREGTIELAHIYTVDSQVDPYVPLDNTQYLELKNIYLKGMHKVLADLCDESC